MGIAPLVLGSIPLSVLHADTSSTYMYSVGNSDQAAEIENLKCQLEAVTRHLHEYKTQIFRSSHPQDLAKISSLNQQIKERDATNQKLMETLKALEKEMLVARKQSNTLEVTADALSALIVAQRKNNEANHQEHVSLLSQMGEELQFTAAQLSAQQALTAKINDELQNAQQTLASYEKRMQDLDKAHNEAMASAKAFEDQLKHANEEHSEKHQHLQLVLNDLEEAKTALYLELHQTRDELEKRMSESEAVKAKLSETMAQHDAQQAISQHLESSLQDALLDSTTLRFQLADLQKQAEEIEAKHSNLNMVTEHLNQLTMSLDHAQDLETHFHDSKDHLAAEFQNKIQHHVQSNQALNEALREKEETLNAAFDYYQGLVQEYQAKQEALNNSLEQAEANRSQLQNELHTTQADRDAHKERLNSVQAEREHLQAMFDKRHFDAIALEEQFHRDHETLKEHLTEKERDFTAAGMHYLSMLDDYRAQIETVEDRLAQAENQSKLLQTKLEEALVSKNQEKEQMRSSFEKQQAEANELHLQLSEEHEALKMALIEKDVAFSSVSYHYLSMLDDYRKQIGVLEDRLEIVEAMRVQLENALRQKDEALVAADQHLLAIQKSLTNQDELENKQHAQLEQELITKEEALKAAAQELIVWQNKYASEKEQLEQLLNEAKNEYAQLKEELDRSVAAQQEEKQRFEALEKEVANLESELKNQQLEATNLAEKHATELAALQSELRTREEAANAKESTISRYQKEIKEIQEAAELLKTAYDYEKEELQTKLEEKNQQLISTVTQLQSLKLNTANLHDELGKASAESSNAEERIAALKVALATTQAETSAQIKDMTMTINKLHAEANEDKAMIAQLSNDLDRLALDVRLKSDIKRHEHEQQVHSFSALIERQERALAEAGQTLHQSQLYSEQLQRENDHLKHRLSTQSNTAEISSPFKKQDKRYDALAPLLAPKG